MDRRSIWPIAAGVLFTIIVTTVLDVLLHLAGVFPRMGEALTDELALIALAYRIPISVAGAWLTARLAPSEPMRHALVLGMIGTVLGAIGVVTTWNLGLGPRWYPLAIMVLALPQCWLGGWLYMRRVRTA